MGEVTDLTDPPWRNYTRVGGRVLLMRKRNSHARDTDARVEPADRAAPVVGDVGMSWGLGRRNVILN
ncbi:hypothetical protein Zm00014a_017682 [Zea mays]|uniref:Uncharacterized protein n=1 Tax=Zea mays TaxID=4577 RepID=A0A3L6E5M3_MAIZE|nr:hypothetical protein Zm00014a_017682 [Zea mays]